LPRIMKITFKTSPGIIVAMALFGMTSLALLLPNARAGSGCDAPPSGLISWWRAESNALDYVGGNNGTLVNNAGYTTGEVGTAFFFTNALAAVKIGNATNLQLQSFTIEAWIQRGSTNAVSFPTNSDAELFGFGSQGYGFGIHGPNSENGSQGTLFLTENDVDEVDTTASITDTNFHHVAVTKSGLTVVFYVDGVAYPAGTTGDTYQFTTPAAIGARGDTLAGSFYGAIDEMSIYNRGLLATEIAGIFNAGAAGKCPIPVITTQPVSQSVLVGSQVQFSVVAQSTNSLSYQWMLDGTNLPPDTNSTLTLTNVQMTNAGSYTVAVSNLYGAVTSAVAVLTVSTYPPCLPPASGLVDWWPAEGNALDVITGSNGVVSGTLTFVPGMVGHAFKFDGTDTQITFPAGDGNFGNNNFTIDCWVNTTSTRTEEAFLGKRATCDASNPYWDIRIGSGTTQLPPTGFFRIEFCSGGDVAPFYINSTNSINDGLWHHFALTRQGATMSLYLDGLLNTNYNYGSINNLTNGQPMIAGTSVCQTHDSTLPYSGALDELDLWNRALSASEIAAIYNAGSAGKCLALSFLTQPTNNTVAFDHSAMFTVAAEGSVPLFYQWSFDTTNILSATNSTLVLTNVQVSQAGSYSVVVSNPDGFITSSNAILNVTPAPPCISAPSNLIAWWRAEGNALDELGGLNGTPTGSVSYAPGEVGQGFLLGGLDAAINLGYATNLQLQNFTIEAWIRRTTNTIVSEDPQGNGLILGYGLGGYGFFLTSSGTLALTYIGYSSVSATLAVTDTNLHHVAVTKSGSSVVFYLDGVASATSYSATFTFSTPVTIGARGDDLANSFYGLIDELAVYNRALAATEIQSIYNAGSAGKCPVAYPPVLVLVPASQSVLAHGSTSLLVSAAGSVPLTYQWNLDGTNLPGATNPVLALNNIQIGQAGSYSVTVSNSVTNLTSTNAVVTVTYPTAPVKVVSTNAVAGSLVTVPVTLTANGNENSAQFSLDFAPAALTYAGATLGSGAVGASLWQDTNSVGSGLLGIAVLLPAGSTFASATDEVVRVNFLVTVNTNSSSSTSVTFGGVPVQEQLADPLGNVLPVSFTSGTVTIAGVTNFEGDVNGDVRLTLSDWLEEGQFVAQLATPSSPAQFQRADCAPRSTLGDADLTVIDWVQVGRYVLGLDPLTATGGPTAASGSGTPAPTSSTRLLTVSSPTAQLGLVGNVNVCVTLAAQGKENAAGFTLSFPATNFSFSSATLGTGASGATLILNTNQCHSGILGAVLALPPGNSFPAGSQQLLSVNLNLVGTNSGASSVALSSQLIKCEISDTFANPLPVSFVNGAVTVNPIPSLGIALSGTNVVLSWPLWASNFLLQSASGGTPPLVPWSNSPAAVSATTSNFVTLPLTNALQFFRLDQP
jgi:hypothetical protein